MIYVLASIGCTLAPDITTLLALRAVQGLGAGAGSVLGRAIIRDLFDGPRMARMLSLALAAFITAPIVAPTHRRADPERSRPGAGSTAS